MTVFSIANLTTNGFALLRDIDVNTPSLEVANQLGTVDKVEGLASVQTLVPRKTDDSAPNTYSGNFGLAEFPLHTDLAHWARPPRYVLLRCIRGSEQVETRILDGKQLIEAIGADLLYATLVHPRRPMRNGKQLLRILAKPIESSCELLRWDSIYLRPATRRSSKIVADLLELIRGALPQEVNLRQGDSILLDNWRCLHGRSAVKEKDKARLIERVYLREIR